MIHIQRPNAPAFLTDPNGKWAQETERAMIWYGFGPQPSKEFPFKHYNDDRLKEALRGFFYKCAYCDNRYRGTSDGDVEHFRPKGSVKEKTPRNPGYYWLANDWDNLLLSCQHCNQNRRHVVIGATTIVGRGKMDQFPMAGNTGWVTTPGAPLLPEEPIRLLINPCIDQPDQHLKYDFNNANILGIDDRGNKSIEVYVLRRKELVDDRNLVLLQLKQSMELVKEALELYNDGHTPKLNQHLVNNMNSLLSYGEASRPFAGMARYFIKEFMDANGL